MKKSRGLILTHLILQKWSCIQKTQIIATSYATDCSQTILILTARPFPYPWVGCLVRKQVFNKKYLPSKKPWWLSKNKNRETNPKTRVTPAASTETVWAPCVSSSRVPAMWMLALLPNLASWPSMKAQKNLFLNIKKPRNPTLSLNTNWIKKLARGCTRVSTSVSYMTMPKS